MTDLSLLSDGAMMLAFTGSIAIVTAGALKGWNGWLALKRAELDLMTSRQAGVTPPESPSVAGRIELADLKERLRKLEAIAAGIDI